MWRVEVEPVDRGTTRRFLNVLLPRLAGDAAPPPHIQPVQAGPDAVAVRVGATVTAFANRPEPLQDLTLPAGAGLTRLLLDAAPGGVYRAGRRRIAATREGVLVLPPGRGRGGLRISLAPAHP